MAKTNRSIRSETKTATPAKAGAFTTPLTGSDREAVYDHVCSCGDLLSVIREMAETALNKQSSWESARNYLAFVALAEKGAKFVNKSISVLAPE
jgi:hypothetical protein